MSVEYKNYYDILGVTKNASDAEIKKAFRKLVRKYQFRLRGKGLPSDNAMRGDLHAIVKIQVPPFLTPEEKVLWEQLSTVSTFNPRKTP